MIEMIEAMMPSPTIDISFIIFIISVCAFVDILSPGVLGVTGYLLLTQPNQLTSRLLVFLFVTQFGYFITGLAIFIGGNSILKKIEQFSQFDVMNWFYVIFGTVLVLISFVKPKEDTKERFLSWIPQQTSLKGMVLLGIVVFLFEFVTALPYFYSLFLLNHISMETIPSILLIIGYNIIMVLPSLLLLGVNKLFKKKVQKALNKIRSKLKEAPVSSILIAIGVVGAVFFNIGLRGIIN